MLGKFLITALVLVIAWTVIRKRQQSAEQAAPAALLPAAKSAVMSDADAAAAAQEKRDWHIALYGFVGLIVVIAAGLYYAQWQRDHQVLTVRLIQGEAAAPVSYQVYRYALEDRRFVTVDGVSVVVASDERMEVEGL